MIGSSLCRDKIWGRSVPPPAASRGTPPRARERTVRLTIRVLKENLPHDRKSLWCPFVEQHQDFDCQHLQVHPDLWVLQVRAFSQWWKASSVTLCKILLSRPHKASSTPHLRHPRGPGNLQNLVYRPRHQGLHAGNPSNVRSRFLL